MELRRAFQKTWYKCFEWMEYSVIHDAAFCFTCRLFGKSHHTREGRDSLIDTGFSNWKRALDSFKEHEKTALHKASMICWKSFQATNVHGDIVEQLMTTNIGEITERREYLRRIVEVIVEDWDYWFITISEESAALTYIRNQAPRNSAGL